jgi:hypothetical protein
MSEPPAQASAPAPVVEPAAEPPPLAGEDASPGVRAANFDSFWPARRPRRVGAEPSPPAPAPAPTAPAGHAPPPAPSAAEEPTEAAAASEEQPVTIIKSGVVDGMAYTLYSDGSIEAQLAQGTIRFRSINELRMHLENAA